MSNELYFPEKKKARHTTFLWLDAVTTFFFNCWFFVVVPAHVYTQSFPVFQDYQSTPRLPEYTQTTRIHPEYQNTPRLPEVYTQSFPVFQDYQMLALVVVFRSSNLLFTGGEFGIVYRARLIRSTLRKTDCEIVAVKIIRGKDEIQPWCK